MIGRVHLRTACGLRAAEARGGVQSLHEAQLDVPATAAVSTEEVHVDRIELDHRLETGGRARGAPAERPAKGGLADI